jgi:hypothetical protein
MKRQIAIAVLALIGVNGVAFAQVSHDGKTDEMAPAAATGAAPERGSLPPSSYGLINTPNPNTYYFAP